MSFLGLYIMDATSYVIGFASGAIGMGLVAWLTVRRGGRR